MNRNDSLKVIQWLDASPSLDELIKRYPKIWDDVNKVLVSLAKTGKVEILNEGTVKAKTKAEVWKERILKGRGSPKIVETGIQYLVNSRMMSLALERCYLASNAGKVSGKVRFNLLNGLIIQKLLFSRNLTRKPVSMFWFKFWWRLVRQRKILMPLVQSKGIYCFYSKEAIKTLRRYISGRSCLEIAAGDGTLARFLRADGTSIIATDDLSWKHVIDFPPEVENLSARCALEKYQPKVVVCSWPPAGNDFERYVFQTESVDLYIVIGSRHKFVSGNWKLYEEQEQFELTVNNELGGYILPPELESKVLVFSRKRQSHISTPGN